MRTLKLTIAYDGTRYAGWQRQDHRPQSTDHRRHARHNPTIQGTIERVLHSILQEPVRVIGSGRTDAGVHALAQVAHVNTCSPMARERLLTSLNQLLPPEIAVTRIEDVPASFHARFRAATKRYRYRIFTGSVVPPFVRPYVHPVRTPLDVPLMRREVRALLGRHNFRAFARASRPVRTARRTITQAALTHQAHELHLDLTGDGFLHTMVRSIAGTLIDVGRGRLRAGTIRRMLRTGDRRLAGTTAPAQGLTLVSVGYKHPHG